MSSFWLASLPVSQQSINYRVASHCAAHPECTAKDSLWSTSLALSISWWAGAQVWECHPFSPFSLCFSESKRGVRRGGRNSVDLMYVSHYLNLFLLATSEIIFPQVKHALSVMVTGKWSWIYLNPQALSSYFLPCPTEDGKWVSSWMGAWLLAKANLPLYVSLFHIKI